MSGEQVRILARAAFAHDTVRLIRWGKGVAMAEIDNGDGKPAAGSGAISDAEGLANFIAKRADETWDALQRPYHLSLVATELAKQGVDYKHLIAPLRLREWALGYKIPGTRVHADPVHKAKVVFAPENVDHFTSFEEPSVSSSLDAPVSAPVPRAARVPQARKGLRLLRFVDSLAALSEADIGDMQVPARVLVRLYDAK